jgi:hypothetical protein
MLTGWHLTLSNPVSSTKTEAYSKSSGTIRATSSLPSTSQEGARGTIGSSRPPTASDLAGTADSNISMLARCRGQEPAQSPAVAVGSAGPELAGEVPDECPDCSASRGVRHRLAPDDGLRGPSRWGPRSRSSSSISPATATVHRTHPWGGQVGRARNSLTTKPTSWALRCGPLQIRVDQSWEVGRVGEKPVQRCGMVEPRMMRRTGRCSIPWGLLAVLPMAWKRLLAASRPSCCRFASMLVSSGRELVVSASQLS